MSHLSNKKQRSHPLDKPKEKTTNRDLVQKNSKKRRPNEKIPDKNSSSCGTAHNRCDTDNTYKEKQSKKIRRHNVKIHTQQNQKTT